MAEQTLFHGIVNIASVSDDMNSRHPDAHIIGVRDPLFIYAAIEVGGCVLAIALRKLLLARGVVRRIWFIGRRKARLWFFRDRQPESYGRAVVVGSIDIEHDIVVGKRQDDSMSVTDTISQGTRALFGEHIHCFDVFL